MDSYVCNSDTKVSLDHSGASCTLMDAPALARKTAKEFHEYMANKYTMLCLNNLPHSWFKVIFDQSSGDDGGQERVDSDLTAHHIDKILRSESRLMCPQPLENIWKWATKIPEPNNVRVVVTGQNPYNSVENGSITMADGLAFSVNPAYAELGKPLPPTLINIMKLADSLFVTRQYDDNRFRGDLTTWAEGGALLLNSSLTTVEGVANAHADIGWEKLTDRVIAWLGRKAETDTDVRIFMLWGNEERRKIDLVDCSTHVVMTNCHPSPLTAHKYGWFDRDVFKEANIILRTLGHSPIRWSCRQQIPKQVINQTARTAEIEFALSNCEQDKKP